MERLEIAFRCNLWNTVLQSVQKTSTKLQEIDLDLAGAVDLVLSLRAFIASLQDQFDRFESAAKELSSSVVDTYTADTDRQRRCKKNPDESSAADVGITMTGRQKFAVDVLSVIIDNWTN